MRIVSSRFSTLPLSTTDRNVQAGVIQVAQWRYLGAFLLVADLTTILLAFELSYFIRFYTNLPIFRLEVVPSQAFYQSITLLLLPGWVVIFFFYGLYNRQNLLRGNREGALLFRAIATGVLTVMVIGFVNPDFQLARAWLFFAGFLSFLLTAFSRYCIRRIAQVLRRYGYFLSPAIIVGANPEGLLLAEQLSKPEYSGLKLFGFVDSSLPVETPAGNGLVNLGAVEDIDHIVQKHGVEEIIIASSSLTQEQIIQIFRQYGFNSHTNVRLSTGLYEIITTGIEVTEFSSVPLVKVNKVRLTGFDQFLKTALDYFLAVPGLILISPLLLLISLLIKLDSAGPVFYRRRVMGVNSSQFNALKFRTMHVNGDEILEQHPALKEELAVNQKLKDDPRITRVGKFLRKTSLDEIPQAINVLLNQMSIVGPRMISPEEMARYKQFGLNLLTVKPGITGLWQVSGRSDVSYAERVQLDMYYIRNWSIWLDLQLLIRTIPAVFSRRGAY